MMLQFQFNDRVALSSCNRLFICEVFDLKSNKSVNFCAIIFDVLIEQGLCCHRRKMPYESRSQKGAYRAGERS